MENDISCISPEILFGAIVGSSEDAIVSETLDGVVTYWNPSAERLFGFAASEIVGRSLEVLYPPGRLAEERALLEKIRRGEGVSRFDTVRRTKSGELVEVSVSSAPIRDPQGRVIGAARTIRDIRPQKHAEEQFRLTLASIGDGVIATDVHGNVTFMNSVAESLVGWSSAEAKGRALDEVFCIFNEDTGRVLESPVSRVLREGRTCGLANHTRVRSRDGRERPIDDAAAPIRNCGGGIIGVVLVFRDVSDRRAAQLAAVRLAAIVEGSNDAIVGKNLQGIVTSWNSAAERMFGYTAAEMIGRPISTVFPPDRLNEEEQILARLQRGESVEHFETVRVRKDGTRFEVSLAISPIRNGEGQIVGASKIARDITAQKEAERALRDAQAQLAAHAAELEEKVEQRTAQLQRLAGEAQAFSYSLSHDIRAPLRAILGFADAVLNEFGGRVPEANDYLRRIVRAAQRMDRLLTDVLSFSQLSQLGIPLEPIDPGPLLRDIIAERRHLQPPAAEIVIVEPLSPVLGNLASLTQCLSNLLENAVKFVAPGVCPRVKVFTTVGESGVRLSVEDNGIGIRPADQDRLFAVFQRLHSPDRYEGTGLGLAIVRRAAERMGGVAGVTSTFGAGSTFWIELKPVPRMA